MAITDDQIVELRARNAANSQRIDDLKKQYSELESSKNNDIKAKALNAEAAKQEAEIAILEASVASINGGAAKSRRPENNQFSPTTFSSPAHNVAGDADEN